VEHHKGCAGVPWAEHEQGGFPAGTAQTQPGVQLLHRVVPERLLSDHGPDGRRPDAGILSEANSGGTGRNAEPEKVFVKIC